MARSKNGKRRAIVLIAVHVLIIAHIVQWKISGSTLSPVEPSEAMQTLERGAVNAGFIFFALALLATLIFGRFMCGWLCHVVALQDLCYWMLRKIGIRPKPFRSRLLIYAPLLLALYMFVWPTAYRILFTDIPAPTLTNHMIEEDFWQTFAGPLVAIPFLLICGFATVYFLGAKGFCTYGCPYGGFFAPVDKVAPGRIVVDHDKCEGCGHCTAACTSNVRVHEEISAYGMVVDPGCMKCMDCVSVCPNDALSFGFTRPAAIKGAPKTETRPKRKFDLTWGEEIALALVLFFCFMAYRNLYGLIPMLMAIGAAGCSTYIFWIASRILSEQNVRFHQFQLRKSGRTTGAGASWLALAAIIGAFTLQSGVLKYQRLRGDRVAASVGDLVSREAAFAQAAGSIPAEAIARADRAIAHLNTARPLGAGGIGFMSTPAVDATLAMLHVVKGDAIEAEALFRRVLEREGVIDQMCADLLRTILMQGRDEEAIREGFEFLNEDPDLPMTREVCANIALSLNNMAKAIEIYEQGYGSVGLPPRSLARLANLYAASGRYEEAVSASDQAMEMAPTDHAVFDLRLSTLLSMGEPQRAIDELMERAEKEPEARSGHLQRVAIILRQLGRDAEADAVLQGLDE